MGFFVRTGEIAWLLQCQWSNTEWCEKNRSVPTHKTTEHALSHMLCRGAYFTVLFCRYIWVERFLALHCIDGLVQDCSVSSALAMEILQSCMMASIKPVCKIQWCVTHLTHLFMWHLKCNRSGYIMSSLLHFVIFFNFDQQTFQTKVNRSWLLVSIKECRPLSIALILIFVAFLYFKVSLIARFMGPTWCPSGPDRTQVGPMLVPWTLLSGMVLS